MKLDKATKGRIAFAKRLMKNAKQFPVSLKKVFNFLI